VKPPRRILVVRNDKLGDFTLALPVCELLHRKLPGCEVTVLIPEYTREVAELAPGIDHVLIDPGEGQAGGTPGALAAQIREREFDASITLFSTVRVGLALFRARVPARYAPATKFGQFLHNRRIVQRRSQSTQPEYEYNLDLARRLLADSGVHGDTQLARPVLPLDDAVVRARRLELNARYALDPSARLVMLHCGHGGSANNLTVDHYARLASGLRSKHGLAFLCTAGPGETAAATELACKIEGAPAQLYESTDGLGAFVRTLAAGDLFIGGSTGPLHLAGALNRPTVAFYPRRGTSSPLRWQAMNADDRRLAFAPPEPFDERDLSGIDLEAVAREVNARCLAD
jgi:ADP-heptose:LPS heptosyltransferase